MVHGTHRLTLVYLHVMVYDMMEQTSARIAPIATIETIATIATLLLSFLMAARIYY